MPVSVPSARAGQRLGEVLLDELRERLLAGSYPVGSRISIEEVKAEFGVSKQPVMDAMRRLEATGIVEIVPQSGCRVAHYSARRSGTFSTSSVDSKARSLPQRPHDDRTPSSSSWAMHGSASPISRSSTTLRNGRANTASSIATTTWSSTGCRIRG